MPHYLVAIQLPDNFDPSLVTQATIRDIDVLNEELEAAAARVLGLGLSAAGSAKSLRAQPDGKVLITDGPYLETKEHVGGFWILKAANMYEALAWGAQGCRRLSGAGRGARDCAVQRMKFAGADVFAIVMPFRPTALVIAEAGLAGGLSATRKLSCNASEM